MVIITNTLQGYGKDGREYTENARCALSVQTGTYCYVYA